jgi:hypothetical protein
MVSKCLPFWTRLAGRQLQLLLLPAWGCWPQPLRWALLLLPS